jgi:hypothetical protein
MCKIKYIENLPIDTIIWKWMIELCKSENSGKGKSSVDTEKETKSLQWRVDLWISTALLRGKEGSGSAGSSVGGKKRLLLQSRCVEQDVSRQTASELLSVYYRFTQEQYAY